MEFIRNKNRSQSDTIVIYMAYYCYCFGNSICAKYCSHNVNQFYIPIASTYCQQQALLKQRNKNRIFVKYRQQNVIRDDSTTRK